VSTPDFRIRSLPWNDAPSKKVFTSSERAARRRALPLRAAHPEVILEEESPSAEDRLWAESQREAGGPAPMQTPSGL